MVQDENVASWEANCILLPQEVGNALLTFGKHDETSGRYLGKQVESSREVIRKQSKK